MKAEIEIADTLLAEVKRLAAQDDTTLESLVAEGLRQVVGRRKRGQKFRLRDESFRGEGLQPGLSDDDWPRIRELAYKGRGA